MFPKRKPHSEPPEDLMRIITLFLAVMLMTAVALAQTPVPPPPKPLDSGPSLETTMKFIQDKLGEVGKVNWVANYNDSATGRDWVEQWSVGQTKVLADASACRISSHYRSTKDGRPSADKESSFSLRDVEDVVILRWEQHIQVLNADAGHASYSGTATPAVFVLKVRQPRGRWTVFFFPEEEMANRVARAMVHAVELCSEGGGKTPEPF